jgi:hypothetical protein
MHVENCQTNSKRAAESARIPWPLNIAIMCPASTFSGILEQALRAIDERCHVTVVEKLEQPFSTRPRFIGLDLDMLRGEPEQLIQRVACLYAGVPVLTMSDFAKQTLRSSKVEHSLVIHFNRACPRLLIEGALRLIIGGSYLPEEPRAVRKAQPRWLYKPLECPRSFPSLS